MDWAGQVGTLLPLKGSVRKITVKYRLAAAQTSDIRGGIDTVANLWNDELRCHHKINLMLY